MPSQHPAINEFSRVPNCPSGPDSVKKEARTLSGEGVVSSYSVEATGLVSRHGSEFGTLMATQSCGLETVAQAILGALKSLQRRSKAGYWQHSSFGTVCQQLASSQLLPTFRCPARALQEFRI